MTKTISRLVLNFPGFEVTSARHQIERLSAGGEKTAQVWGFKLGSSAVEDDPASHKTVVTFSGASEQWQSTTRYVHFSWTDIVEKYEAVPYPKNLWRHLPAYLAFFRDGTVLKYRRTGYRYYLFTIYPLLLMILFAIGSWFGASYLLDWLGLTGWLTFPFAFLFWLILCKWPGDKFYMNLSVNDWAFARDMCFRSNPEIEARYDLFANHVIGEVNANNADEILIVGHSFGSVWAVTALAKALDKQPDLFKGKRVTFLALGSSFLKIALVKQAEFIREAARKLLSAPNLVWHDIQTKTDFISFYKAEPFEPIGIVDPAANVVVHRVNFKNALSKARHRKMKQSMYLAHRQYILYCDERVHHDFQLRVFGPFFADELAQDTNLAVNSPLTGTGAKST